MKHKLHQPYCKFCDKDILSKDGCNCMSATISREQKEISKNLFIINNHKLKITIESRHMPGGAEHNLVCWLCNNNPAVYSMHPNWIFKPCWDCQKKYGIGKKNKWWEFWK